jgi:hypothetical protein
LAAFTSALAVSCARSSGRALELGEELDGPIEVIRANFDQLLARSLGEPLREAGVVLRP